MKWQTRSGGVGALVAAAVTLSLAVGCAKQDQETKQAVTTLESELAALERKIDGIAKGADKTVIIKVKGSGMDTRLSRVIPDHKPICKEGKADCPTEATWRLSGTLEAGWTVEISQKGNTLDPDCFTPPDGGVWTLDATTTSQSSGVAKCPEGSVWEYDVVLKYNGQEKGRIDPLFFIPFI
jgi:hypothetical protein